MPAISLCARAAYCRLSSRCALLRLSMARAGSATHRLPEPQSKPVPEHAVDYLIERVLAEPNEISIFPIGPLTNIAMAIRKEPKFANVVKELVIMGGAILEGGNMTALAEFNIYVDPHAAHIVFHSGIPMTFIPLDVTQKCLLKQEHIDRLIKIDSPITRFIKEALEVYLKASPESRTIPVVPCMIH